MNQGEIRLNLVHNWGLFVCYCVTA